MASWYDSEIQMLGKLAEIKETPANIQYFLSHIATHHARTSSSKQHTISGSQVHRSESLKSQSIQFADCTKRQYQ